MTAQTGPATAQGPATTAGPAATAGPATAAGPAAGPSGFAPLSTHVLDTVRGEPARGIPVRLERRNPDGWSPVATGDTDSDGRLRDWVPATAWTAGDFRLVFLAEAYLAAHQPNGVFFPEITVAFRVADPQRHHHVPLLLSLYGYTTYRGS